jgi:exodeoxyribonuclease V alpha subunit
MSSSRIIERAVEEELAGENLIAEPIEEKPALFLAALHRAERGVAEHIARLGGEPCRGQIAINRAIPWAEEQTGLNLSESQREAVARAVNGKVTVITGGPGVDKATVVNSILRIIRAKGVKVLLCAPTGRAAKRLSESTSSEAKTIHRLLELDPRTMDFKHNQDEPLDGKLVVADEVSMVDTALMNQLLRAVPDHCALLLVGDVDQLPSVVPGAVLADMIASGTMPTVRLTEIFRQAATSKIIVNAHRINRGGLGARSLNIELQQRLNPRSEPRITRFGWTYAPGDKVIQTVNNYDKDVFNGDIGRVVRIDEEERLVFIDYDGRRVEYETGELDEVSLACATTVHKSQGSEYPAVVIPLGIPHYMLLERNLLYTTVIRGKRLVVLIGQTKALAMAVKHLGSVKRLTNLQARLRQASKGQEHGI